MKPVTGWSYNHYLPPLTPDGGIYLCRLAPSAHSITAEWTDVGAEEYTVTVRRHYGIEPEIHEETVRGCECTFTDLTTETEYEIVVRAGEKYSRTRRFRTAEAVGDAVVNYLHPHDDVYAFSGKYLCSPSLVRHPDGHLLAAMDLYASGAPQNLELIFRSDDDGKTWHHLSELYPCFWGDLFVHRGTLYMLSCSTEYGDLLIGRSDDGGKTFTTPTVLLRGSCKCKVPGVHKNPQPPLEYNGRLWFTMEWGSWGVGTHSAMVGSFPLDADPLDAASWCFSEPLPYDPSWEGVAVGPSAGTIEGTLAVLPDGKLYNIMRYDMIRTKERFGKVLAYRVNENDPEAPLTYSHAIEFPANHAKFMIRRDEVTGDYYTVACRITDPAFPSDRRLLSLMKSKDCAHWETVLDLMDFRDRAGAGEIGFQYPSFFIEGDDILLLCRTAMNAAHNYHDSNYSTFHRIRNFRDL